MARKLLTDYPTCKTIIDGAVDDELEYILQAVAARRRAMDRLVGAGPGSRFTVTQAGARFGEEGTIVKVNPKRYIGHFDGESEDREYSIPKTMVAVRPTDPAERAAALKAIKRLPNGDYDWASIAPPTFADGTSIRNERTLADGTVVAEVPMGAGRGR